MSQKEYLDKLKKKYDIKHTEQKSQYITREEFHRNLKKLKNKISSLYSPEIVPEIIEECKNYKVLELWEDPPPNVYIKSLMIFNSKKANDQNKSKKYITKQGLLISSSPLHVYIGSEKNPQEVSRCNLILTKYTTGEMELINLQSFFTG